MQIDTTPAPITVLSGAATSGRDQIDIRPEVSTTFDDVLNAVNPLNYIPIVSDLVGSTAPAAGKIAMGALMGGPFGMIAGIASAIFEAEMGQSPVEAVVAALTGDSTEDATQLAALSAPAAAVANDEAMVTAAAAPTIPVAAVEQLVENTASATTPAAAVTASAISRIKADAGMSASLAAKDKAALLSLYGESANSAHQSYKKAQLLPYLRDVGTSKLL